MLDSDKDKFGFYTVGDFKTYSKVDAIEFCSKTNQSVKWNFNDEIFSQFDWTVEPPGDLEFYYAERARQIRERYDYIVIWYSGGSDSHNVLMSFVKNNIFVDEIAQFHNLSGDHGNKKGWMNHEVFSTSAPSTQHLIENNPVYKNTKHRLVDLTEIQTKLMSMEDNKWDYFYKVNNYLSMNALARGYIRDFVPDYTKLAEQKKKLCFVHGSDKPELELHNKKWFVKFSDHIDNNVSVRTQMLNRSWEHDELFYWSPDLPQLISKQAHVVRRYLDKVNPSMVDDYHLSVGEIRDKFGRIQSKSTPVLLIEINKIKYQLLTEGLNRLIYPHWVPGVVVGQKPYSLVYSPRDAWVFGSNTPDFGQKKIHQNLVQLKQKIHHLMPEMWYEFKYDPKIASYSGGIKQLRNIYPLDPIAD